MDTHAVQLLAAAALDLQPLEGRGDVPDVVEGDVTELHTPLHGDTYAEAEGVDHVGQVLAAVEAGVGHLPHTVDGPGAFRFSKDILEGDLRTTKRRCRSLDVTSSD